MKEIMNEYGESVIYCIITGAIVSFFFLVLSVATIC